MEEMTVELLDVMERLAAAVEKLTENQAASVAAAEERVGAIVAMVESERETELARRLEAAEAKIAELQAAGTRKTAVPASVAKPGAAVERMDASVLDAALANLSVEQRIAVKAELLRAGAIG